MMDMPPDLQTLQSMTPSAIVSEFKGGKLRMDALKETAIGLGIRGGLNHRTKAINDALEKRANELDRIYDFRGLLISAPAGVSQTTQYAILPPVITEANQTLLSVNDYKIQASDKVYRIESQARFVTAPPTWRDYLFTSVGGVEPPDVSLLPKDGKERDAWKKWIEEGWQIGQAQADSIFDANMSRLSRDYSGMVRYKVLLKQNIVSRPYVAEQRMGVTGGDSQIEIDSRQLDITVRPSLNARAHEWKPIIYGDGAPVTKAEDLATPGPGVQINKYVE